MLLGHPADYSAINDGRELAAPGLQKLYIGHPKYSESWLKPLIKKANDFAETAVSRQNTTVLVLSRGYGSYLDATSHVELVEETVAAIQYTLQNFQILVKKHPREVDSHWDVLARENDYIEIVYDHMLQIATRADFVVTFWGSGAMDCYRLGLPIIEFWDPNALSKDQVKVQDGYTTIYRLLGIVLPVESRGELQQAIELLSRGDQKFGQRSPHPYFVELIDRSNEWDKTIDRILQAHKFV